jgi:protein translocase SecG subunit
MASMLVLAFVRGDPPGWLPPVLNVLLGLMAVILIGLVLIQRGKGGGLAGAFGGAGGSSAFGSRAGDAFTRWTIYLAAAWIFLVMITIVVTQKSQTAAGVRTTIERPDLPDDGS